jgi:hypothetical protein
MGRPFEPHATDVIAQAEATPIKRRENEKSCIFFTKSP